MKNLKGYIFSRKFYDERVPQHIQNLVLRNYCQVNKLNYLLSATEYAMKGSSLMLNKILNEIEEIDGLVFYSLFQLPQNKLERKKIYKIIINFKKEIHFAVEDMKIKNINDIEDIEQIIQIKQNLPYCLKSI
tara:strand:+ start:1275 stop:1670 length:396 start_codon:yes stop_codon:yes gene_type:complete